MAGDPTVQLVAARYQLGRSLGAGGGGRVWEAEDTVLERPVAVKSVDLPAGVDERERELLRARVLREARAAARIDHPDSVRVFDVVDEPDRIYIVMELVDAPTLAEVVERDGFLAPPRAACMGLEVLDALEAAHAAGIVHRDVKPRNVMVLPDGHVKLADFGIATVKDDPRLTVTGMVIGTPSYMSPEQARGDVAGPATDLWGLGTLLYYAVEGVSPFDRGEALPTLNAVLHDEPRPVVRAGPLTPVITRLLAKDPAERPGPGEVRRLLDAVAAGDQPTVVLPGRTTSPAMSSAAPATEVVERFEPHRPPPAAPPAPRPVAPAPVRRTVPPPPARRSGRLLAGLGVAGLALVLLALVLANRGDDGAGAADDVAATDATDPTDPPADAATDPVTDLPAGATEPGSDPGGEEASPSEDDPSEAAPSEDEPSEDEPSEDPEDGAAAADVPSDWVAYTDPGSGYRLAHPPGWAPTPLAGRNAVDFRDPATGAYLRVDYVRPPGEDAVRGWEAYEPSYRARHPDYQRITIEPADFGDYDAALWEYTFGGQRASNLAIVTEEYGFALNFVAAADRWEGLQDLRRAFEASFEPPG